MVARTTISDGYRARAHAMVALARSWRPTEVLPGARTWVEASQSGQEALSGLSGHLAIEPPPRRERRRARVAHATGADRAGAGRPSPAAGRGRGRPRRRPGRRRPRARRPPVRPRRSRAGRGGRGPLAQAPPASSRLASQPAVGCGPVAAAAPASRPGGTGRTGAPAMTRARPAGGAERPPRFAAVRGPRPLRGPARPGRFACWTGCHTPTGRVEGHCALMSARSGLRPAPRPTRPGHGPVTPVARGGRGAEPDQQAAHRGGTSCGSSSRTGWSWAHVWPGPCTTSTAGTCASSRPPRPTKRPRGGDAHLTGPPPRPTRSAAPRAPRRGHPCPTPTSPSLAT
jgi:hypothetical protein